MIVGVAQHADTSAEAFRWTAQTGMVGIGRLPGGPRSGAASISAAGTVIVGESASARYPQGEAFRWENGRMVGLGTLPGDDYSSAYAVSGDGRVIVGRSGSDAAPRGFRWTAETGMVDLGDLALTVNWNGSVVGGGVEGLAAFWDADGWHDLRSLLVNRYGLDLSQWPVLGAVVGLSADGNTMVGSGFHPIRTEGWLAHISFARPADLNCDDHIDFSDINPFVLALTYRAAYETEYPDCRWLNGDVNGDGHVDWNDIDPFVALLAPVTRENSLKR